MFSLIVEICEFFLDNKEWGDLIWEKKRLLHRSNVNVVDIINVVKEIDSSISANNVVDGIIYVIIGSKLF
jgi:hypothetical protein